MSITYLPKIPAVLSGECTQTIRRKGKKQICVGDIISFHGWQVRPYRSPWSWRKRVVVTDVYDIDVSRYWLGFAGEPGGYLWNSDLCNKIATEDFIDPPTGEALRDALFGLNGAPKEPAEYQIIRWEPTA